MKIKIEIPEATYGRFSDIKLCFQNEVGQKKKVALKIGFEPLYDFSKDLKSIRFDMFLVSSYVYGIDIAISRDIYSVDGWAREFEVKFPVKNLSNWEGSEDLLARCLSFLTGDQWQVSFTPLLTKELYIKRERRRRANIPAYIKKDVTKVSLFSGGLDSLMGVINDLNGLGKDKRILFASHFDSGSVGPNSDQTQLERILSDEFPNRIYWVQTTITVARKDTDGAPSRHDGNFRSRSFLFIGIGMYLLPDEISVKELIIPENGTISLNYPLTPSRVSSLSTRTTHPYVIRLLQELISSIGADREIRNPYGFETKGEMVEKCKDKAILKKSYPSSVSCGKRGRKSHWDVKIGTKQCGVCMPCIYRRAALHKVGWDNEQYGIDLTKAGEARKLVDLPALIEFLTNNLSTEKIKRDLIVNGSLPAAQLNDYARVVQRSRQELIQWLTAKGNAYIQKKFQI